ncbi:hypothetical protein GYMLUDRAFT_43940 [Collybiopsis luxurians FD-317 M1]|uniref:HIT domain-containing protein n=1 Tax=Collybiopsis luxurians FD-317 M1 TaxID=944289 RepID=A0A0D0CNA5_9AGAR|nr:hypothetical protein GYMLUDRAFT_43940 [Collybiopsis luxurians FD-317 M1]
MIGFTNFFAESAPKSITGWTPPAEYSNYSSNCSFCNVSVQNGFNVLWENEDFVAFMDRSPACEHHFQVVPKKHISSVKQLGKSDVELLNGMFNVGNQLLDGLAIVGPMRKMGFHISPFNSIDHLHLHVQALPYKSILRRCKYPIASGFGWFRKGFSWFVEIHQAILILQEGRKVGVFPC